METKFIFLLLILVSLSSASWLYSDSTSKVCFNVSSDGYVYGKVNSTFYNDAFISIYNNNSMFSGNVLLEYHNFTADLYKLNSGTNYTLLIPLYKDMLVGSVDEYCIYGGGSTSHTNLDNIVNVGFTSLSSTYGSCTGISSNRISTIGGCEGTSTDTSPIGSRLLARVNLSAGNLYIGSKSIIPSCGATPPTYTYNVLSCTTNSCGNVPNIYYYYQYDSILTTSPTSCSPPSTSSGTEYTSVMNTSWLNVYNNTNTFFYDNRNDLLVYLGINSNATYDYAFKTRISVVAQNYTASDITYDFRDMNIHIVSPAWGGSYTVNDVIPYIITYSSTYDNCSLELNGVNIANVSNATLSTTSTGYIYNSIIGSNDLKMSCYKSGVESHNYATYYVTSVGVVNVFMQGLGVDVGAVCSGSVITALSGCNEYYKLYTSSNFGAVVCKGLNLSIDYSCIGTNSYNKSNYTIFYSPSYWVYPTGIEMQHMGATFYYNSLKLSGGIELLPNNQFIYLPAQNKSRDCSIYYLNTNYCSWGGVSVDDDGGVILNNGSIYIADKDNSWFTTAGLGLNIYNENVSQFVVNDVVVPVNQGGNISNFGFYTRTSCIVANDSFNINIQNTMVRNFVIAVIGNNSYSYSFNSSTLNLIIPLNGSTFISIFDGTSALCEYDGSTTIFLPAIFRLPFDEGFGGFFPKVMILLTVVLSTIIPYALFGTFIFNDLYHVIPLSYVGVLTIFAVIGGLVNNISQFERGIKHMILLLAIVVAYIVTLAPLQSSYNFNIGVYTSLMNDFRNIMFSTSLYSFALGIFTFIVDLFLKLIFLPVTLIQLIYDLMLVISPTLFTSFISFKSYLECGAMLYFYLKSYEVISNRFRIV